MEHFAITDVGSVREHNEDSYLVKEYGDAALFAVFDGMGGAKAGEAAEDAEGLQTMRTLANNMVFLMRSIALGKEKYGLPEKEEKPARTNFIR